MQLQDTVAVVTGASSGLGRAFAEALVEAGAVVFGLARSIDRLNEIRDRIGERFHPMGCDVADAAAVEHAFQQVEAEAGRLDVLINNAGLGRFGNVADLPVEEWDEMMATNLRGVFLCSKRAIPIMRRQNEQAGFGGHIVNIASIAGLLGNPGLGGYNASKFGVRGFSEALMKEVRDDGIKVTCVYPGSIDTSFSSNANRGIGSKNAMTAADITSTVLHILQTDDNYLISEIVMRPLRPKG